MAWLGERGPDLVCIDDKNTTGAAPGRRTWLA
jgi:hypothetical protein